MLVILNGPPHVGKDTIGTLLSREMDAPMLSFKSPMWEIAEAMLGKAKFEMFCEMYHDRATKEQPLEILGGKSPREFFIYISEDVAKPLFGQEYFGERMLEVYQENQMDFHGASIVTDGGFPLEVFPFLRNHAQVVVVRLFREGYTFGGDSRSYLKPEQFEYFPSHQRPSFIDVHLEEGQAQAAANHIVGLVRGK